MNSVAQENKFDQSRKSTPEKVNRDIDQQIRENLQDFQGKLTA
ncbi:hypothetical protein Q0590_22305 [Rhodocytophaga aerolata]|uniref:Uncharacterized protein n=1 Tax=Rhodocytophaga aerolata TaxID=455078 RepID=A0ABT8RA94_9BACT|nr:hypothetical protein [Rhodocytophaga aerolata]MDO1449027.1 hypothetical protein [Rhodocytophaga aerolata]